MLHPVLHALTTRSAKIAPRSGSLLEARRIVSRSLAVAVALGCFVGPGLDAQTRASRAQSEGGDSAVPSRERSLTHFFVEAEQTRLVHRGEAVVVGRARDQFTSWLELPTRGLAAAAVRSDDGGARALVVTIDESGRASREIALPSARGATQATPKLLAARSREAAFGVAWFEGSSLSQRELFFARASDSDGELAFARPVRLAGRAQGSQVALDAVTLADGRYLLTWSAFDGNDTEILFTVGDGTSWSEPRRLHAADDTPDSFPTLIATAEGALVAWNSLEGHTYSVMTAAFDGSDWSTPRPVVDEPGAEPAFARGADRPLLSFRQGGGWTLVETSSEGLAQRRAAAPATAARPLVLSVDPAGLTLRAQPTTAQRTAAQPTSSTATPDQARRSNPVGTHRGQVSGMTRVEWQP